MDRFVVISGCSGGGKSTLLDELARRGFATVAEPGRRIVADELRTGGRALPWDDAVAFARRAIELAQADRETAPADGWVFFDRGLIDAVAALQHLTGDAVLARVSARYNRHVFLTPPWPELYRPDNERRHGLGEAVAEYDRLVEAYAVLGYETHMLQKVDVGRRADRVLAVLEAG